MLKRFYAVVCSLVVLVAAAGFGAGIATADPFGRTPAQLQAISDVIGRALSARGVPFTYGGGDANGPTKGTPREAAVVTDTAATTDTTNTPGLPATSLPTVGLSVPPAPSVVASDPAADVVGFDASGLIVYSFAGVGIKMPRSSGAQYAAVRKVTPDMALPGDLLFYGPEGSQSVALFIGNGQMVETGDQGVTVSPVRTNEMTPYLGRVIG
ncbi:NlpC/P60 family peptidoglycan-binding protein RipD [soil metagenome]